LYSTTKCRDEPFLNLITYQVVESRGVEVFRCLVVEVKSRRQCPFAVERDDIIKVSIIQHNLFAYSLELRESSWSYDISRKKITQSRRAAALQQFRLAQLTGI
jgi:hypothetical protein